MIFFVVVLGTVTVTTNFFVPDFTVIFVVPAFIPFINCRTDDNDRLVG